jgi:alpha-L-rhamnosidase
MNLKVGIRILPLLSVMFLIGCSTNDWKTGIIEDEFIYDTAPFPSCHASTIAETPNGLIAAWFGGTYERHPDVCIYTSSKVDDVWTEPKLVADGIENDTLRYPTWNPVLYQIPDGDLLLFYKVGPNPREWWGMLKRSADHGKTWSDAEKLPEGYIGPVKNKPVLLNEYTYLSVKYRTSGLEGSL